MIACEWTSDIGSSKASHVLIVLLDLPNIPPWAGILMYEQFTARYLAQAVSLLFLDEGTGVPSNHLVDGVSSHTREWGGDRGIDPTQRKVTRWANKERVEMGHGGQRPIRQRTTQATQSRETSSEIQT